MLVTTPRHAGAKAVELAKSFALFSGSAYAARGKKTVDQIVSEARKKGYHSAAVASDGEIAFISVSLSGWNWKGKALRVLGWKAGPAARKCKKGCEPGVLQGPDATVLHILFGLDSFHSGDCASHAGNGKMELKCGKELAFSMEYEIVKSGVKDEK